MNVCGMSRGPKTNEPAGATVTVAADPERQLALEDVEPLVLGWWTWSGEPEPGGRATR